MHTCLLQGGIYILTDKYSCSAYQQWPGIYIVLCGTTYNRCKALIKYNLQLLPIYYQSRLIAVNLSPLFDLVDEITPLKIVTTTLAIRNYLQALSLYLERSHLSVHRRLPHGGVRRLERLGVTLQCKQCVEKELTLAFLFYRLRWGVENSGFSLIRRSNPCQGEHYLSAGVSAANLP